MKKSFHTVKKAGILTAAAVLGAAALAGCGSKADTTESAAASEEATEAAGEAEASDAQLVIAGGDSAGLIAAVQAADAPLVPLPSLPASAPSLLPLPRCHTKY